MREINKGVIAEFRENNGQLSGPMEGAPILLLTTRGRTSGSPHTTPVGFVDVDGKLAVAAANGGADDHPDWFRNIEQSPSVTIEVGGDSISAQVEVVDGARRSDILAALVATLPGMEDHVAATTREIPVLVLCESR